MMIRLTCGLLICASATSAQELSIVTDIAPVGAIAAAVLGDEGRVDVLVPPRVSPHHFSMRPSDAGALADADLVVWVGEGLTPWLERPIDSLAGSATVLELMDTPGWTPIAFEDHDAHDDHTDDGHDDHTDHGEDDHDAHAKDEDHDGHDHDEHAHDEGGHDEHAGHDHGAYDPHAWTDPSVGAAWAQAIADQLSALNPDGANDYQGRADALASTLKGVTDGNPLGSVGTYILQHDAYGYFETRFGLSHAAVMADGDDAPVTPRRLSEVRDMVIAGDIDCIFYDEGPVPDWVGILTEGTSGVAVIALDPVGSRLTFGPALYPDLISGLVSDFAKCAP